MVKDIQLEIKIRNKDGSVRLHQIVELWKEDWNDTMDSYKELWNEIQSVSSSDTATLPIESIVTQPRDETK